jgi:hypothetical protein
VDVVDERVVGERRNDRVFVMRIDGGDVLGDDSGKGGVVLMRVSQVVVSSASRAAAV